MNPVIKIKPQLVLDFDKSKLVFPCYMAPKLDGIFACYNNGWFYSREGNYWKPSVVAHLQERLKHVKPYHILCGELYKHDWTLPRINSAIGINRLEPSAETSQIDFFVHNLLSTELPDADFTARMWIIKNCKYPSVDYVFVENMFKLRAMHDTYLNAGYEGSIIYNPKGQYSCDDRNGNMMRIKPTKACTARCIGWERGDAGKKYANVVGALKMIVLMSGTAIEFKVSSGLSDAEREYFCKEEAQLTLRSRVFKIEYERVSEDGSLLKPRIVG